MTASERIRAAREAKTLEAQSAQTADVRGMVEVSRNYLHDETGKLIVVVAYGYPLKPWVDPFASKCDPL